MAKIFIIGLPRTGTTSVCAALLRHNLRVAHTAYTQESFRLADVVADTPVYCDYPFLDNYFPHSKFIFLERDSAAWASSMRRLLMKLRVKFASRNQGYHPLLAASLYKVFDFDERSNLPSPRVLEEKYRNHRHGVLKYFASRGSDLLRIDIAEPEAYARVCGFLGLAHKGLDGCGEFPHLNEEGRIFEWGKITHPGKVGSNERGVRGRKYFAKCADDGL